MRGTRDLPQPEVPGVILSGPKVVEHRKIGLRLDGKHRHVDVGADGRAPRRDDRRLRRLRKRRPEATTAVDQEAVVDVRDRMNGVDVVHHAGGRLRFADGDHTFRHEGAKRVWT